MSVTEGVSVTREQPPGSDTPTPHAPPPPPPLDSGTTPRACWSGYPIAIGAAPTRHACCLTSVTHSHHMHSPPCCRPAFQLRSGLIVDLIACFDARWLVSTSSPQRHVLKDIIIITSLSSSLRQSIRRRALPFAHHLLNFYVTCLCTSLSLQMALPFAHQPPPPSSPPPADPRSRGTRLRSGGGGSGAEAGEAHEVSARLCRRDEACQRQTSSIPFHAAPRCP